MVDVVRDHESHQDVAVQQHGRSHVESAIVLGACHVLSCDSASKSHQRQPRLVVDLYSGAAALAGERTAQQIRHRTAQRLMPVAGYQHGCLVHVFRQVNGRAHHRIIFCIWPSRRGEDTTRPTIPFAGGRDRSGALRRSAEPAAHDRSRAAFTQAEGRAATWCPGPVPWVGAVHGGSLDAAPTCLSPGEQMTGYQSGSTQQLERRGEARLRLASRRSQPRGTRRPRRTRTRHRTARTRRRPAHRPRQPPSPARPCSGSGLSRRRARDRGAESYEVPGGEMNAMAKDCSSER